MHLLLIIIESALALIYLVSTLLISLFSAGLAKRRPTHRQSQSQRQLGIGIPAHIHVILPIYHETSELITNCLNSLCGQTGVSISLIVVAQDVSPNQRSLIESFSSRLHSLTISAMDGSPSEVNAYKQALPLVTGEYVCLINADTTIFGNNLTTLLSAIVSESGDIAFGLRSPQITSAFSKFPAIDKVFRQIILQKGRGALGMGYYVPGSFYIVSTQLLSTLLQGLPPTFTYDFHLALRLYSSSSVTFSFVPEFLSSELERSSFSSWCLQYARWTSGKFMAGDTYARFLRHATTMIRVGFLGVMWIWYVLPLSIVAGLAILLVLDHSNGWFCGSFLSFYFFLTLTLACMRDARGYGTGYLLSHWLVSSIVKSLGMLLSVQVYLVTRRKKSATHVLFGR